MPLDSVEHQFAKISISATHHSLTTTNIQVLRYLYIDIYLIKYTIEYIFVHNTIKDI